MTLPVFAFAPVVVDFYAGCAAGQAVPLTVTLLIEEPGNVVSPATVNVPLRVASVS